MWRALRGITAQSERFCVVDECVQHPNCTGSQVCSDHGCKQQKHHAEADDPGRRFDRANRWPLEFYDLVRGVTGASGGGNRGRLHQRNSELRPSTVPHGDPDHIPWLHAGRCWRCSRRRDTHRTHARTTAPNQRQDREQDHYERWSRTPVTVTRRVRHTHRCSSTEPDSSSDRGLAVTATEYRRIVTQLCSSLGITVPGLTHLSAPREQRPQTAVSWLSDVIGNHGIHMRITPKTLSNSVDSGDGVTRGSQARPLGA